MKTFSVTVESSHADLEDLIDDAIASSACGADFLGSFEGQIIPEKKMLENYLGDKSFDTVNADFRKAASSLKIELYFGSEQAADRFQEKLTQALSAPNSNDSSPLCPHTFHISFRTIDAQDWNRTWVDSFQGCIVEPYWKIVLPGDKTSSHPLERIILKPSVGFGSGTHATTALCLKQIGDWHATSSLIGKSVLDFGSGSGILSLAAALKGATVTAVEIDEMALQHSREMATLNVVENNIIFATHIPEDTTYDFIVANILMSTLIDFAPLLVAKLKSGGQLALSGILKDQVDDVDNAFQMAFQNAGQSRPLHTETKDGWMMLRYEGADHAD